MYGDQPVICGGGHRPVVMKPRNRPGNPGAKRGCLAENKTIHVVRVAVTAPVASPADRPPLGRSALGSDFSPGRPSRPARNSRLRCPLQLQNARFSRCITTLFVAEACSCPVTPSPRSQNNHARLNSTRLSPSLDNFEENHPQPSESEH